MKTQEQILAHYQQHENDVFAFEAHTYLEALDYGIASKYLTDDMTAERWDEIKHTTDDSVRAAMLDYMPFAWEKANYCRGLSAMRSIQYFSGWLWLIGEDDLAEKIQSYTHYGKPQLVAICEKFGWDWHQWDDGAWRNNESEKPGTAASILGRSA